MVLTIFSRGKSNLWPQSFAATDASVPSGQLLTIASLKSGLYWTSPGIYLRTSLT